MTHTYSSTTRRPGQRRIRRALGATLAVGALVGGTAATSAALVVPGTPGKDVHIGGDDDNADNPLIQPPGVTAKQHMENTDVLFGRANDDLLIGKEGDDTLLGGEQSDILVGGPETSLPNSDVLIGEEGRDINIWAPGDGSDAFVGNEAWDTMIFAPFVEDANGDPLLTRADQRWIPRVDIDGLPAFSCTIVEVPRSAGFGFQFLVRFNVNGNPVVTVRQKDVEQVYCPSPEEDRALVADLTDSEPEFRRVWLDRVPGTVGKILKPVG
jgi:hypothetical protein